MTQKEVADHVGLGAKTVWNWTKDAELGPKIESLRKRISNAQTVTKREIQSKTADIAVRKIDDVREELTTKVSLAVDAIERALRDEDPKTALTAAKELLDRVHGKAVQRNINESTGNLTVDHFHHLPESFVNGMLEDAARLQIAGAVEAEVISGE